MHLSTHPSQMNTRGPAISRATVSSLSPQNEQYTLPGRHVIVLSPRLAVSRSGHVRPAALCLGQKLEEFMDDKTRTELEAAVYRRLVEHLRSRTDVQNIDMMNLAGFCRNCL